MINKASCLCGSVTWEITTEPFQAFNCHCKLCRKAHGSAFGTYWFMRPDQLRWTSATDTIVYYRSSHLLTRGFCGTCGSVVPYPSDSNDSIVSLGGCHDQGKKSTATSSSPTTHHGTTSPGRCRVTTTTRPKPATRGRRTPPTRSGRRGAWQLHVRRGRVPSHGAVQDNCHWRCRRARAAAHATNGLIDAVRFVKGEDHLKSYKLPEAKFFTQVFCRLWLEDAEDRPGPRCDRSAGRVGR